MRLEAIQAKLKEKDIKLQKILESKLLTVQKIAVIKLFLLPTRDFMMWNDDIGKKQLTKMDKMIRAEVDQLFKIRGLPVEYHHL
jgi:hypothetical protein